MMPNQAGAERPRILLVNAIDPDEEVESRHPHLGLAILAAAVRRELGRDAVEFRLAERDIAAVLSEFKPQLVGISSVSQNWNNALDSARMVREAGVPLIFGGVHVSILPETMPDYALAACIGEGEATFPEMVRGFLRDGLSESRKEIAGLAFWENGKLVRTQPRPPVANLDDVPPPAYDLLSFKTSMHLFTSRGCPFRCVFCSSSRYWNKLRFQSAERVADDIRTLMEQYGVRFIAIYDDLFAADRKRLERVVELLEEDNIAGTIPFTINLRASIVDNELAALLRRMGVVSVGMGLESGSDPVLRYLKGPGATVAKNREAVATIKRHGIRVNASVVIGSPNETREQILETYRLVRTSGVDLWDVYLLTPLPGTPLWDFAKKKGIVGDENFDWSLLNMNLYAAPEKALILSETLDRKELLSLYFHGRRLRFFHNLLRVWNHPLRFMLPRMAWSMAAAFFKRCAKKITRRA